MNRSEITAARAAMAGLFLTLCEKEELNPLDYSLGAASHACFATTEEADKLAALLRKAGEEPRLHHWDPKKDPDVERDEYQVSWGSA